MKKGFTLIELLAVIVIIAVIALITVPIVIGILNDSKKNTAKISSDNYLDAVSNKLTVNDLNEENTITTNGRVNIEDLEVEVSGTKPTSGVITIKDGIVTHAELVVNGYNIVYDGKDTRVVESPETRYVYWTLEESSTLQYDENSAPSITYDSVSEMNLSQPYPLIRTTLVGGMPTAHDVCMYYKDKIFCVDKNYWDTDATTTAAKLKNDLESTFEISINNCTVSSNIFMCSIELEGRNGIYYLVDPTHTTCSLTYSGLGQIYCAYSDTNGYDCKKTF